MSPPSPRVNRLVDLARSGDTEAFGLLYEHYHGMVYRFLYYRVGTLHLAEDFTSETFFRALRSVSGFQWQGRDFGAWLVTIARNLVADHYQAAWTRLEQCSDDLSGHDLVAPGPEDDVLARFTYEALLYALGQLQPRQQKCLVLRFVQERSIAETAEALGCSEGASKQLQRRAVRDLARFLSEEFTVGGRYSRNCASPRQAARRRGASDDLSVTNRSPTSKPGHQPATDHARRGTT